MIKIKHLLQADTNQNGSLSALLLSLSLSIGMYMRLFMLLSDFPLTNFKNRIIGIVSLSGIDAGGRTYMYVLSIIVSNKLSKEDSKKYLKVINKIPIRVKITNTDKKTNNTKIYINIKTFSSIPAEKRIGIYKKLYTKYHELDDLLLISLNNLLKNILIDKHMKLYSKDQYKNINPLKNYKLLE